MVRFLIFFFFLGGLLTSFSQNVDDLAGKWISPNKDFIVECYKDRNNLYRGKLVWFKKLNNRNRYDCEIPENQWLNKDIMWDFIFQNKEWSDGKIKDLKKCNTYDAYITMPHKNKLVVTGFVVLRMFGEGMEFTRFTDELPTF